jgi:hypothetical protein
VRLLLVLALLAATPASAATRATIVLLPATGSNVADAQLAAAGDVLRAHLESTGMFFVHRAGPPTASAEPTPVEAGAAAREAGAWLAVAVHVARLDGTAVVRVAAYAPDGTLVHADELGALGADDLDPALQRLADALAIGGRAAEVATIETVTAKEEAPLRKMTAWAAGGLRIGGILPLRRPDPTATPGGISGLGLVAYHDARDWLADVSLEFYTSNLDAWRSDPDRALALALGVYKPFSKGNAAPYLGLGAAYTVGRFNWATGQGVQARAMAGLLLGRLSNVAARFEAGWFLNAFPVRGPAGQDVYVQGAMMSITLVSAEPTHL